MIAHWLQEDRREAYETDDAHEVMDKVLDELRHRHNATKNVILLKADEGDVAMMITVVNSFEDFVTVNIQYTQRRGYAGHWWVSQLWKVERETIGGRNICISENSVHLP